MGATYTRQSSYSDGDTITAAHTNDEFNQLLAAFASSTGHTHDGTSAEGGPITKLLGTSITIGDGTSGTDITVTFDGETSDGVLKWMEDEDYFEFSDDILIASTEKIQFRDTAIYINSSTDGQLDIVADTEIQIAATTIDINGNVDISGTLTIGSAGISETELEVLDGLTVTTTEVNILDGDNSASSITVADADRVVLNDAGTMKQVAVTDLAAYFDDEITAMPNLTSVGTLTTLTVDNVIINGTTIGHTDDTDLITVASGIVTVAGEISVTTLDIGGTNVTATATELNLLDGVSGLVQADFTKLAAVDSTSTELNLVDGSSAGTIVNSKAVIYGSSGEVNATTLQIAGTSITSTAAELNILDGVTSTASELNILDGVTSTATELNLVDGSSAGTIVNSKAVIYGSSGEVNATTLQIAGTGVTSTTAELNILDGVTSTAAELNILDGVTSTTAELNILDGVTSTAAELNILDGVTSTATELNVMDGDTSASSITLADADRLVTNDGGTMKQVALTTLKTYLTSAGFSSEDPTALAIALG